MNPLKGLSEMGQSVWLDFIARELIAGGDLKRLIEEDGIRGMTSNPILFQKAIAGSADYDDDIRSLALAGKDVKDLYEAIAIRDVQMAADAFAGTYHDSDGNHGFVSLEVDPNLAHDTGKTIEEARRLWNELRRPNVLIKVPGTLEGLPAIRQLISEGINVNVTLLFGLPRYKAVAEAYIRGLQDRAGKGESVEHVRSVASFFLSRIDVLVDPLLDAKGTPTARDLRGGVAVACAKLAYQIYKEIFRGERFLALADRKARPQRVLWASTGTKDPDYSDVKYVEPLIGPETINTMPPQTMDAYRDHGNPQLSLEQGIDHARGVLDGLREADIDIDEITQQLEDEGVDKFVKPFVKLLETLEKERAAALHASSDSARAGGS
jgi:transaldolase